MFKITLDMASVGTLSEVVAFHLERNERELSMFKSNLNGLNGGDIRTILVTSPGVADGKTYSSLSIAYAISTIVQASCLLVDGNLRRPMLHNLFGVPIGPGFSDYVLSKEILSSVIVDTPYDKFKVVPAGKVVANSNDIYNSKNLDLKLREMRSRFDYVVFDCDSIFGSPDALVATKHFDSVTLVIECERTKLDVVQQSKEKIEKAGGKIAGAILNKRKYYIPRFLYGKV